MDMVINETIVPDDTSSIPLKLERDILLKLEKIITIQKKISIITEVVHPTFQQNHTTDMILLSPEGLPVPQQQTIIEKMEPVH
jgi:2-iminoacetate synthase ThiH